MTRLKRWLLSLTSTMKIDPSEYSYRVSENRAASFGYALAGWLYMLRRQKNTRIQSIASILVIAIALWLQISALELALIVLTITIVWMAEFLNAAVEAVIDLSSPEFHPMAKVGKDVASAAVLLGVIASIIIGLLILGPPLVAKLST